MNGFRASRPQLACAATSNCVAGKRPYATEADARDALLATRIAAALRDNTRRGERRCYACPYCGHWHLTSRPDQDR